MPSPMREKPLSDEEIRRKALTRLTKSTPIRRRQSIAEACRINDYMFIKKAC